MDYVLNFEGVFASANGNEIVLEKESPLYSKGRFTKVGPGMGIIVVGDAFCSSMERVNDNTWKGQVRERYSGDFNFLDYGQTIMNSVVSQLTISPNGLPIYNYTRVSGGNTGGGGGSTGGGGTDGGTGTSTEILINQCITGSEGDKKFLRFTLPANVKKLEIKTFEESGSCDRNTADLFIRKGSDPTVTKTPSYSWVADYYGIKPNREDEICVFNNPASGQWSVMLFGYNTYFISKLKVTITK